MQDKFEKYIKQSLQNHEMDPPANAWENISKALQEKKPKAKPWSKWMAIAALILPAFLAISIWFTVFDNAEHNPDLKNTYSKPDIVDRPNLEKSNSDAFNLENNSQEEDKNFLTNQNKKTVENNNQVTGVQDNKTKQNLEGQRIKSKETVRGISAIIAKIWNSNDEKSDNDRYKKDKSFLNSNLELLGTLISPFKTNPKPVFTYPELDLTYVVFTDLENDDSKAKKEKKTDEKVQRKNKRGTFEVSPFAGAAIMGSFNEASLISPEFNRLKIDNPLTSSYGAKVAYNFDDDVKIRTGIGMIDMRQNTYDVPMAVNSSYGAITYNLKSLSNVGVDLSEYNNFSSQNSFAELEGMDKMAKDISHELQFIEVPLEIEYNLTKNNKLNFAATGGMSTLFLNKNEVLLKDQNAVFAESTNMKSVSFSANAGMKLDYAISPKVSVNVEPQMRYMINTVTANSELQPFLVALNAGLSWSF